MLEPGAHARDRECVSYGTPAAARRKSTAKSESMKLKSKKAKLHSVLLPAEVGGPASGSPRNCSSLAVSAASLGLAR